MGRNLDFWVALFEIYTQEQTAKHIVNLAEIIPQLPPEVKEPNSRRGVYAMVFRLSCTGSRL